MWALRGRGPRRQAGFEFGAAAYRIEDISGKSPADEFSAALLALRGACRDIERQVTTRDDATLVETRVAGEAALADGLAAAEAIGPRIVAGPLEHLDGASTWSRDVRWRRLVPVALGAPATHRRPDALRPSA